MRCVAILFLLYTAVDLAYPQICAEENLSVAASHVSVLSAGQSNFTKSIRSFSADDGSQRNLPEDKEQADEDCFCCCAHIVPGVVFVAPEVVEPKQVFAVPVESSIPQDEFEPPYHPPRFS